MTKYSAHNLEENPSTFSGILARLRKERGLSQGQLAKSTRLSRTYVYHLETGQRDNPSASVVRTIARALDLHGNERQNLYDSFTNLTGISIEEESTEQNLLELSQLASLLVANTLYPAHSLDRLWYVQSWNKAVVELFELDEAWLSNPNAHLLTFMFTESSRKRFRQWESIVRRLISDFKRNTRHLAYTKEYKDLWQELQQQPDFRRISESAMPSNIPSPSFVIQIRHSKTDWLTLRTSATVFSGIQEYSMVSYIPGDQHTLQIFQENGWQKG